MVTAYIRIQLQFAALAALLCWTTGAWSAEAHPDWDNALRPHGEQGPEITLALAGHSEYAILLPAASTPRDEKAADELAAFLQQMTTATFPVVHEGKGSYEHVISIGKTQRLRDAQLPMSKVDLGNEGIGIAVEGDDLYLIGGAKRGAVYAVYSLLEEDLGCEI